MNVKATAVFTGRDSLGRFVEQRITPGIRSGLQQWLGLVKTEAQVLCPVDTGELINSIDTTPIEETEKTIRGSVQATAGHAGYVEYGTGQRGAASEGRGPYPYNPDWPGMPAQPYLRPAADHVKEEGRARMIDEISSRIT